MWVVHGRADHYVVQEVLVFRVGYSAEVVEELALPVGYFVVELLVLQAGYCAVVAEEFALLAGYYAAIAEPAQDDFVVPDEPEAFAVASWVALPVVFAVVQGCVVLPLGCVVELRPVNAVLAEWFALLQFCFQVFFLRQVLRLSFPQPLPEQAYAHQQRYFPLVACRWKVLRYPRFLLCCFCLLMQRVQLICQPVFQHLLFPGLHYR